MDMGLGGMGGAAGAGDATNLLFQQRMEAAKLQQQDQQFKAQLAQQDALTRLKAQEVSEATRARVESQQQLEASRKETERQHNVTLMSAQLDQIPTDAPISGSTMGKMTEAGIAPERFAPTPIAPDVPASIAAPGGDAPMPGTIANSPAPNQVSFTRIPTAQEKQHQQDELTKKGEQDWKNSIAQQLADLKGATPPTSSYQLQPEIDPATGKQTGRYLGYNTKTNRWEPVQGEGPASTKAGPGAAAAATEDRAKTDALDTLGQLDQAIDAAKDLIGPGAGRVSSIEQMVGSADPKIQALGVKMKAAKMRADHAITGSVRAGASPTLIKQWDNILANNITPEGLKAGVQALREIIGGSKATGKPTAEELIKKYGGGH